MRKKKLQLMALPLALAFAVSTVSPASATTLKITLTYLHESEDLMFDTAEPLPSTSTVKALISKDCKRNDDLWVGAKAKAVNEKYATAGLGKITGYKIGKIYAPIMPTYSDDDDIPDTEYVQYLAACIYSVSIPNLRSANFYRFSVNGISTEEYDSKDLAKKKWKLSLVYNGGVYCGNYSDNLPPASYCSD